MVNLSAQKVKLITQHPIPKNNIDSNFFKILFIYVYIFIIKSPYFKIGFNSK